MDEPSPKPTAQAAPEQVWREPMLRVAERHGVSSSFLARICTLMNVPRPPRGYATGRLCLQAFSPYGLASWKKQWRESADKKLTNQLARIVTELTAAAGEIARLVEEGERQAEIRRRQWEEERRQREEKEERARRVRAREEARKELLQAIDAWGEVRRIQAFLNEAEATAQSLQPDERGRALARIELARLLIGEHDALDALLAWRSPDER